MPRPAVVITSEQVGLYQTMFLDGYDIEEIVQELKLSHNYVKNMCAAMTEAEKFTRRRARVALRYGKGRQWANCNRLREPSAQAWADRDRRFRAPRTITAERFGDPRAGQSALDKMRGAAA